MLLGMLSLSDTHAAYPVIVQTKASDMRSGSIRSAGGKWKPGSDPICSGDSLFIAQINPRICARDRCSTGKHIGCAEAWTRGGNGGSRSFLGDVSLSFVSMIVLRKGKGTCVEENGSVSRWTEG